MTFRPEFQPHWIGQPRVTMLALSRLDWRDRVSLVAQIAGDRQKTLAELPFIGGQVVCLSHNQAGGAVSVIPRRSF